MSPEDRAYIRIFIAAINQAALVSNSRMTEINGTRLMKMAKEAVMLADTLIAALEQPSAKTSQQAQ